MAPKSKKKGSRPEQSSCTPIGLDDDDIFTLNSLWEGFLTVPPPRNPKELWEDHKFIYSKINMLMEGLPKFERPDRFEKLDAFLKWADDMGIERPGIEIGHTNGISLTADYDKPAESVVIRVPFAAALTTTSQGKTLSLRKILDSDEMVKSMDNIALAITLAHEVLRGDESPWKPYIDILPANPETPLFYDLKQFENLKPSPVFEDAIRFYRSVARHYAYFYLQIYGAVNRNTRSNPIYHEPFKTPVHVFVNTPFTPANFTFDLYRWCVATVSTRINIVPIISSGGNVKKEKCASLIPFLDFANHDAVEKGAGTLYMRGNVMELYMDKEVKKGQEITMFYGPRFTSLFLLHNGFVPSCVNHDDAYLMQIGLPAVKGNSFRKEYLSSINVRPFYEASKSIIYGFYLKNIEAPVIRAIIEEIMNHGDGLSLGDSYRDGIEGLWKYATTISASTHFDLVPSNQTIELRARAQNFLSVRFKLLLNYYQDVDGDRPRAHDEPLSVFYARRLKAIERQILENYASAVSELNCVQHVKPTPSKYKAGTSSQPTTVVAPEEDTVGTYAKLLPLKSVEDAKNFAAYVEDFFTPMKAQADAADLEVKPIDSDTKPADSETNPVDSKTNPTDSEAKPIDPNTKRADSETKPANSDVMPAESSKAGTTPLVDLPPVPSLTADPKVKAAYVKAVREADPEALLKAVIEDNDVFAPFKQPK